MALLYKIPVKMLSDLIRSTQTERALKEGARARGHKRPDTLDAATLEDVLKNEVFKMLQYNSIPAPLAKRRLIEVIQEVHATPADEVSSEEDAQQQLDQLEEGAKQFALYFDWAEVQRLRSLLTTARTELAEGRPVDSLIQEAQDLLTELDRRLREGLVVQGQDLAELKASFERVKSMGGRDVKRLENLIGQIEEAQDQQTLLPGEVERARNITFKLRKNLESSVMQGTPESSTADAQAQARVMAIEQEHADRLLTDIGREFLQLLRARAELREEGRALRERLEQGQLTAQEVEEWKKTRLEPARIETLKQQRERLEQLRAEAETLPKVGTAANDVRLAMNVAQMTLEGGALATDELKELENNLSTLKHSPDTAAYMMEIQRDLADIERSAREYPGAEETLRAAISEARTNLVYGRDVDLTPLWTKLQEFMGRAAQQREDFNERADDVIAEHAQLRALAGETIQRLGRLADTLRKQRRLDVMSSEAREKYIQTVIEAESLLSEARAEYQAAQEITSTFGNDALDGLLDVFDMGEGGDLFGLSDTESADNGSFDLDTALNQQPTQPKTSAAVSSPFESVMEAARANSTPKAVAAYVEESKVPASSGVELAPHRWEVVNGHIAAGALGSDEHHLGGMASFLGQADRLGLTRLDMGDSGYVWSARQIELGRWRLARARNWDDLETESGNWLDYGAN